MRVIVIGAGFVGNPLCDLMEGAGHNVVRVTRNGADSSTSCDVSNLESLTSLREEKGTVDIVIHCASSGGRGADRTMRYEQVYVGGCQNIINTFPDSRFVFVSSSSVYAQRDGSIVDEESITEPLSVTSQLLLEAESITFDFGGSVARLAGIYGPGRSYLLKRYIEGDAQIDENGSESDGRWINQIHRDDAASALAHIVEGSEKNGIYNVCDDEPMLQRACYEEFDRRFKHGVPELKPAIESKARGWTHKKVSNSKLKETGWVPKYPSYFDALDKDDELLSSIIGT
ncbi:MAG: NAD-dependent epimerase/dehydratase family protein [Verrucomicrobiales bacterium]|nr:NAD-dependent epimerase/dehydratase family protein [Verrucomicrobiales bacterium]